MNVLPLSRGNGSVCAVVVTFNRLELLKKVLETVHAQTRPPDCILVINNGSTDETANWLETQAGLVFVTQGNEGNSGGQGTGIRLAVEAGYDWVWCMDDDVGPLPFALERQLEFGENGKVVLSRKIYRGEPVLLRNHLCERLGIKTNVPGGGGEVELVNFGHFEGMLIPRVVVEKIGLPDNRFFVWGEDILYGYLASTVTSCLLPREPLFEKFLPEAGPMGSPSFLYFNSRNQLMLLKVLRERGKAGARAYLVYTRSILSRLRNNLLRGPRRLWRCRLILSGVWDGLTGNWGRGRFFSLMKA